MPDHPLPLTTAPFDTAALDALMEAAGLDALLVTSKHNVQYLLGGYRFFFFDQKEAIGLSRYLPVVIYPSGRPDRAAYVAARLEGFEHELGRFWMGNVRTLSWGSLDAMGAAVEELRALGLPLARIGIEPPFLPSDAADLLRAALPGVALADAVVPLERLRAVKTSAELELLREASERVVAAMAETFAAARPGMTKRDLVDHLRRAEQARGLTFEYCLTTAGSSLNRAVSDQVIVQGDILSLDSGGNFHGYIGDLCRMAVLGEPDAELIDLLAAVEAVQQAARRPLRDGVLGGEVYASAMAAVAASPYRQHMHFLAHGMGLVAHEAPRLTGSGFVPYPGYDEARPLAAGMVVSIETEIRHPRRGFIKLEDTVAVTATGCEGYGDTARGWTRAG